MSLDKKAILKEIEVLIRSIKVHYDNIENEYRIPTIELELITSKIRKLHEKSIIYNHLHYLEEEQLHQQKRFRMEQKKQQKEDSLPLSDQNNTQNSNAPDEEPLAIIPDAPTSKTETIAEIITSEQNLHSPIETPHDSPIEKTLEIPIINTITASESFIPLKIASKIGLNDRFRFIKNLFGNNGLEMEEHIKKLETCSSKQELNAYIEKLKANYKWSDEDENVADFFQLLQ